MGPIWSTAGTVAGRKRTASARGGVRLTPVGSHRAGVLGLLVISVVSYVGEAASVQARVADQVALKVNWLYGAFVLKDVPLEP